MNFPGVVVADAGQAYEALSSQAIQSTNNKLFQQAKAHPHCSSVHVMHGPKPIIGFGGCPKIAYRDRTVCLLKSIQNMIAAFLGMSQYKVGPFILQQITGIPIGGTLSASILEGVCADSETQTDLKFASRKRDTAAGRYADDLILISLCKCRTCLLKFIVQTYQEVVVFDASSDQTVIGSCVVQPYLDSVLFISWNDISVGSITKNVAFAITGDPDRLLKHSVEPFVGRFNHTIAHKHRSELLGRLHRWKSLGLERLDLIVVVCVDMVTYIRLGFSLHAIQRLWLSVGADSVLLPIVHQCLKLVSLTYKHLIVNHKAQLGQLKNHSCLAQGLDRPNPPKNSSARTTMGKGGYGKGLLGGSTADMKALGETAQPACIASQQTGASSGHHDDPLSSRWHSGFWKRAEPAEGQEPQNKAVGLIAQQAGVLACAVGLPFTDNAPDTNPAQQGPDQIICNSAGQAIGSINAGLTIRPPTQTNQSADKLVSSLTQVLEAALPKGDNPNDFRAWCDAIGSTGLQSSEPPAGISVFSVCSVNPNEAQGSSPQEAKIRHTIQTLSNLAGNPSPANVEDSPAFKKLKSQVDGLTQAVSDHTTRLSAVETTCDETSDNVKRMLGLMTRNPTSLDPGGHPTQTPSSQGCLGFGRLAPLPPPNPFQVGQHSSSPPSQGCWGGQRQENPFLRTLGNPSQAGQHPSPPSQGGWGGVPLPQTPRSPFTPGTSTKPSQKAADQ